VSFTTNKKFISAILIILSIIVYKYINSDNKIKESAATITSNPDEMVLTNTKSISQKLPSKLQKKILVEKEKIQNAKTLHKNILKTRKEYLLKKSQEHSKYLSYNARYKSMSTKHVEQKFKSIKRKKEKKYRQEHKQYSLKRDFQQRTQIHKRVQLDKARIKGLTNIQKKQIMYKKYIKGE